MPRLEPVSISSIVEQSALLERRVPIVVQPSPDLRIAADRDQLQQLFINLFKNAAEAASDSDLQQDAPTIQVSWRASHGNAVVHIVDNGPGLANPANLFVPFYTTKPEGTGIGLTLSQQIAAAHHGSVRLSNRQDASGCLVELTLPLLDADAAAADGIASP